MGKNLIRYSLILTLMSGALLLGACGDEGCTETVTGYNVGTFSKLADSETTISKFSVYGVGQPNDSAMIAGQTQLNTVELILNPDTTFTELDFLFVVGTDTIYDTVTFYYQNRDFFLSIDCGCSVFHTLDSVTHTNQLINAIEINNPEITNEKTPNFTIYY